MIPDIVIEKLNEAYIKVICSNQGIERELWVHFSFDVPNARFSPMYRKRLWNGKIYLYNSRNKQLYTGLFHSLVEFAETHKYTIQNNTDLNIEVNYSLEEAKGFIDTLNIPDLKPRDYQIRAFALAVRNKRGILVSPTASGKSLIAYLIARYYNCKTLIVVPTTSLVLQLKKDFASYGYEAEVHGVMAGVEKKTKCAITVSTWQSLYEQKEDFFNEYDLIIGDECHLFKAKSLISIMTKMKNTSYRFGMTGTLDGAEVNELVLTGLFGRIENIVETSKLIETGALSPLRIKILVLTHNAAAGKALYGGDYHQEMDYIVSSEARNKFIRNLAHSLAGNTLILFSYVDKHGKILYELIKEKRPQDTFFVAGEIAASLREEIREAVEKAEQSIIVASYGVFQLGINIKRLHNIIFASPSKSRIRVLQSIGRGLRRGKNKYECRLFDIADNLSHGQKKNFTLQHLAERVKMYNTEGFLYDFHEIQIKEKENGRNTLHL